MALASSALLAPHFTARELGADLPEADARIVANLRRVAAWLETARGVIGAPLRVTSGFRPPEHNAAVGGSTTSDHPNGLAADFVPMAGLQFAWYQALTAARDAGSLPPFDQLIFYPVEGHIHVGLGSRMRGEVRIKLYEGQGGIPLLTSDLVARLGGFARAAASSPVLLLAVGFLLLLFLGGFDGSA